MVLRIFGVFHLFLFPLYVLSRGLFSSVCLGQIQECCKHDACKQESTHFVVSVMGQLVPWCVLSSILESMSIDGEKHCVQNLACLEM